MDIEDLLLSIEEAPPGPRVGAFFDFDGTLIDGYSATALYAHRLKKHEISLGEAIRTVRAGMGGTLDETQFAVLLTEGISGWAGRPVDELDELGKDLYRTDISGRLVHDMWRVVKAHQRRGHTVAIASSATRFQVDSLANDLGIDHVLCTQLESHRGKLTGRLLGRPLWGPGKLAAVEKFIDERTLDSSMSFAYANGDEDPPFLETVGHPHAVNPQPELAAIAQDRDWPVILTTRRPHPLDPAPALRTAAMYGAMAGAGVSGIVLGLVGGSKRAGIDLATSSFAQVAGVLGGIRVQVTGEENVWSQRPAVFMINHQSALVDALVTSTVLRSGFTAVAKKEAASVPVLGPMLRLADFAFIDRTDPAQSRTMLDEAVSRLASGTSIVISPEGTRSYTPAIGPFKKGGFHLAMRAGVPIVPIVIRNAGALMARTSRTARTGTVEVRVLEPISTSTWTRRDLDRCATSLHARYRDILENWPGDVSESPEPTVGSVRT
ncbi:MAG: HAD-superfamily subfamily hydrolase [Marmoricola sp.]|nr:HAD-superfamily subfamily hydrolase [Marmoricola sp.]